MKLTFGLLGWYSFKVQAYHKFYIIAGGLEGYGGESWKGFKILQ